MCDTLHPVKSHVTHTNESFTHMNESCHTHEGARHEETCAFRPWELHVANMNVADMNVWIPTLRISTSRIATLQTSMLRITMIHLTYMNDSPHTHEWFITHMNDSHTHEWFITHMNDSSLIYQWFISYLPMKYVTRMNESRHTYEWVTSHVWMSHVTRMNMDISTGFIELPCIRVVYCSGWELSHGQNHRWQSFCFCTLPNVFAMYSFYCKPHTFLQTPYFHVILAMRLRVLKWRKSLVAILFCLYT